MSTAIEPVEITVNGEAQTLPVGSTLGGLLRVHEIDPEAARGVAVAVNDEIVRREAWDQTPLSTGDRVEIVTAKQGG